MELQISSRRLARDSGASTTSGGRGAEHQVIENIGSEQDLPVLIDAYVMIVIDAIPSYPGNKRIAELNTRDIATIHALNHAIEKLTKTANPGATDKDRVEFWSSWWEANERRIITGN